MWWDGGDFARDLVNLIGAARILFERSVHGLAESYFTSLGASWIGPSQAALRRDSPDWVWPSAEPDRHVKRAMASFGLVPCKPAGSPRPERRPWSQRMLCAKILYLTQPGASVGLTSRDRPAVEIMSEQGPALARKLFPDSGPRQRAPRAGQPRRIGARGCAGVGHAIGAARAPTGSQCVGNSSGRAVPGRDQRCAGLRRSGPSQHRHPALDADVRTTERTGRPRGMRPV